jgi:uncharacterized phage protein (TIGR01671 family)
MREIKFRAWDSDKNKMVYPSSRQSITSCCSCIEVLTCHEIAGGRYHTDITYTSNGYIMQYTGLKDNNGKEIYEGDIIQTASEDILVVIWNKNFASFCLQKDGWLNDHYFGEAVEPMDCVVIGNIYENPELLKQMK